MQEEFDDMRAVAPQVFLKFVDRIITLFPDVFIAQGPLGKPVAGENFGMHANDQDLFVVGPVENSNAPALRQANRSSPEKIVIELLRAWMLEAEHLTPLRVHAGHDV